MRMFLKALTLLLLVFPAACTRQQQGTIKGMVVPQGTAAMVAALQNGKSVISVPVDPDGGFTLVLTPGTYRITASASAPAASRSIDNVVVRSGELFFLPAIDLAMPTGTATLFGRVQAPQPGSEVVLIQEGVERASVRTDLEGKYEFKELPAGDYIVLARMPGHAEDSARIAVSGNQRIEQNARLFPIATLDGVDWASGKIRASGIGLPPPNAANAAARKAMAQRAALADGQRNLLRTIEQIRVDSGRTVQDVLQNAMAVARIQGFLRGAVVVSEREMENGKIEVILELPLAGPGGLSKYVPE